MAETFNFPYHKVRTEYPESGTRVQLGGNYIFTAPPNGPDLRRFTLSYETMFYYEVEPTIGPYIVTANDWAASTTLPVPPNITATALYYDNTLIPPRTIFRTATGGNWSFLYKNPNNGYTGYLNIYDGEVYEVEAVVRVVSLGGSDQPFVRMVIQSYDNSNNTQSNLSGYSVTAQSFTATTTGLYTMKLKVVNSKPIADAKGGVAAGWYAVNPAGGPNWRVYLNSNAGISSTGTVIDVISFKVTKISDTTNPYISRDKNPTYNMMVLEDFYNRHKLHKSFIYPHSILGNIECKFYSPLKIPEGNTNGNGSIKDFTVELIEVNQ